VNVIVVIAPRPVAVNEESPPKPFPLKEVIVLDAVPSKTTTEISVSSTEK
jgi:hypothetical protein